MLEGDAIPLRPMVLFVADVYHSDSLDGPLMVEVCLPQPGPAGCPVDDPNPLIPTCMLPVQLSDGWHGVKAQFDIPLTRAVRTGKIAVGTKLCVFGAEVAGKSNPVTPLELSESTEVHLKLSANSTRRAKWDAKVQSTCLHIWKGGECSGLSKGYCISNHVGKGKSATFPSTPMNDGHVLSQLGLQKQLSLPVRLDSLCADGGVVGCVDVLIVRAYPLVVWFIPIAQLGAC